MIRGLLAQFWPAFKDRYQDRLEAELFELGDAFVEKLLSMEEVPPELQTVTHGDFRIDNMLFGHPEGRAVILDWQTIAPSVQGRVVEPPIGTKRWQQNTTNFKKLDVRSSYSLNAL